MTGRGGSVNQVDLCVEQLLLHCERSQLRRFSLTWQEKPLLGVEVAKTEWRETTGEDTRWTSPIGLGEAAKWLTQVILN